MKKRIIVLALTALLLLTACTRTEPSGTDTAESQTPSTTQPTDTTAGTLEMALVGEDTVTLEYGTEYEEAGVTVTWNGQPVTAEVTAQTPDPELLGSQTVIYTAEYNGQTAQISRTVEILDTQAPEITLVTDPESFTPMGEEYQEEGYTALDNYDGDLTDSVERWQEGDTVFYRVTDSSGNSTTVERVIVYVDVEPPVITLLGDAEVAIMAGDTYQDPGCSAWDYVDGDLTEQIQVSGSYSKYIPGTYTITYTVRDADGNEASATRKITVQAYVQPDTVNPDGKVIYLTFDDGPCSYTLELLEILEKYNAKATFFVVGTKSLQYLDDIVAGGHSIGIHANTHTYSEIYASTDAFFEDFFAMQQKIYDYTGVWTTLCRFPGGSSNTVSRKYCKGIMTELTQAVTAMGFQYFDWNVSSGDAGDTKDTDQIVKNVINGIKGKDYAIVLQHDIHKYSVDAVEQIIQWGLANGYTFLGLDATSPTVHHKVNN